MLGRILVGASKEISEYGSSAAINLGYGARRPAPNLREPISIENDASNGEEFDRIEYGGLPVKYAVFIR